MKPPYTEDGQERMSDGRSKGAMMGRGSSPIGFHDPRYPMQRIHMCRVPINSGGYDSGGAYWGGGKPLYCAWTADGDWVVYLRASCPSAAKASLEDAEGHKLEFFK